MTTWTKLSKARHTTKGRDKKLTPVVRRYASGDSKLCVPSGTTPFSSVNIYSDGNGRLAFHFCDGGEYAVFKSNKTSLQQMIQIPAEFVGRLPFGTTDVTLTREGDFYVLDLNQIQTPELQAAE